MSKCQRSLAKGGRKGKTVCVEVLRGIKTSAAAAGQLVWGTWHVEDGKDESQLEICQGGGVPR